MKKLIIFVTLLLIGCGSEEDFKEQSRIQSEQDRESENRNREEWADRLERDLKIRRGFVNAIEGVFEGNFDTETRTYNIRLAINPTIPEYLSNRVRTLAELEYELQNLNLNIQLTQWNEESQLTVGCVFENIKPDLERGVLNLISEDCSNAYTVYISDLNSSNLDKVLKAIELAIKLKQGEIEIIDYFVGEIRSNLNPYIRNFSISRIEP